MKLSQLVLGMALALGLVAGAAAQTAMKISISTAQNSHQGVAIDTFAKEVEKRTNGRYKVQTFYNGALGGERESIEARAARHPGAGVQLHGPDSELRARDQDPRRARSCSATRRTPAPCWTARSARRC